MAFLLLTFRNSSLPMVNSMTLRRGSLQKSNPNTGVLKSNESVIQNPLNTNVVMEQLDSIQSGKPVCYPGVLNIVSSSGFMALYNIKLSWKDFSNSCSQITHQSHTIRYSLTVVLYMNKSLNLKLNEMSKSITGLAMTEVQHSVLSFCYYCLCFPSKPEGEMYEMVLFFIMQLQEVVVGKVFTFSVSNCLHGTGKEHRIPR